MADAISVYDATNTASVTDDGGANPTISNKAHPIVISEGTGTGTGDCQFSTSTWSNIDGVEDIGVFDNNDNLLPFEIDELDTVNNTAVVWVYLGSLDRDNTNQVKVAAGSGTTDDQNVTGTWDNAGQNAEAVWHLGEASGTTIDSTANNNDSVSTTGTVFGADGQFGDARTFDGMDDNISFGDITYPPIENTTYTVVSWFKLPSSTSNEAILAINDDNATPRWAWRVDSGGIRAFIEDASGNFFNLAATGAFDDDAWHLGVIIRNGDTATDYVDNTQQATETDASVGTATPNDALWMGAEESGQNYFGGEIDEVRIYSDVKDSDWRQADYDASPKAGQTLFSWGGEVAAGGDVTDTAVKSSAVYTTVTTTETNAVTDSANTSSAVYTTVTSTETNAVTDTSDKGGKTVFDDFEDGDVSDWSLSEIFGNPNTEFVADNQNPISGTYSAKLTSDADVATAVSPSFTSDPTVKKQSVSVRIGSDTGSSNDNVHLSFRDGSTIKGDIFFEDNSRDVLFRADKGNSITFNTYTVESNYWRTNTVHTVSIIPDNANDRVEILLDGQSKGFFGTDPSNDWKIDRLDVANVTGNSGSTRTVWFDDIILGDATLLYSSVTSTETNAVTDSAAASSAVYTTVTTTETNAVTDSATKTTAVYTTVTSNDFVIRTNRPTTINIDSFFKTPEIQSMKRKLSLTSTFKQIDMGEDDTIKQGDTGDPLTLTLKQENTSGDLVARNLSTANSVKLYLRNRDTGTNVIDGAAMTVSDAANGEVEYSWQAGDTDTPGVYEFEVVVDFPSGEETWPNDGFDTLTISEDLQ